MTSTQKFILIPVLALTVLGGGALLGYANLSSAQMNGMERGMGMRGMHEGRVGIHGEITDIDGKTLTVKGLNGTTYRVLAGDAEVRMFTLGAGLDDSSLRDLKVGDTIGVRGGVEGTTVTATDIMSGDRPFMGGMKGHRGHGVQGEVIAHEGTTLTVQTNNGEMVNVEAGNALVTRMVDTTLEEVKIGDQIGVQGEREGTTVTARHIMDGIKMPAIGE
jgi:hypothetical protein